MANVLPHRSILRLILFLFSYHYTVILVANNYFLVK